MNDGEINSFYRLLREYDELWGSSNTTLISLEALIDSIRRVKCSSGEFQGQLQELFRRIREAEPRVVPLIHLIDEFEARMAGGWSHSYEVVKEQATAILRELIKDYGDSISSAAEKGRECVSDEDVIILQSPSSVVMKSLVGARREQGKHFRVLVLKHDFSKTKQLVRTLAQARIGYVIIPEYDLSPYVRMATKLFIGALSVTPDKLVVAAAGTSNVVSFCHVNHIPVYLFVTRFKFSTQPFKRQDIHEELESMSEGNFSFRLTTHSHDTVPLELIDHVVTDQGELPQSSAG